MEKQKKHGFIGYSLADFIHTFPEGAHLKDAKNFQYQYSNKLNCEVYGLNSEDEIRGKTVFDLDKIMKNNWPKDFAQKIHEQDLQVVKSKKPMYSGGLVFLNKAGYVVLHAIMKIPVFDKDENVVGVLSLSFDSTKTETIEKLREHYKKIYKNKDVANIKFMEHIGFDEGIKGGVTDRELDCLISLVQNRAIKVVASNLSISLKTVESHIQNIKEKLECHNLSELVKMFLSKNL